jgi:hypothetical protein
VTDLQADCLDEVEAMIIENCEVRVFVFESESERESSGRKGRVCCQGKSTNRFRTPPNDRAEVQLHVDLCSSANTKIFEGMSCSEVTKLHANNAIVFSILSKLKSHNRTNSSPSTTPPQQWRDTTIPSSSRRTSHSGLSWASSSSSWSCWCGPG